MTVSGDTVCSMIQSFPIFLIMAQNHNRCLTTPLYYKPPSPTQSPEYYEALDALFQTLFSNNHGCDHHHNHGHDVYNYGGGHDKPYYVYTKKPSSYTYPSYPYGYPGGDPHGPCHGHHHGYPVYGYKKVNIYNVSGVKYGNKGYAPGNQLYNYNNHKYKIVVKRPKFGKKRAQKLQEIVCTTKNGGTGTCVEADDCVENEEVDLKTQVKQPMDSNDHECNPNGTKLMVCCSYFENTTEQTSLISEEALTETDRSSMENNEYDEHNIETLFSEQNNNIYNYLRSLTERPALETENLTVSSNSSGTDDNTDDDQHLELPQPPVCGISNISSAAQIVNGPSVKLDNFPWFTALGYRSRTRGTVWKCAGSIITSKHALTAAHCIRGYEGRLYTVRLGIAAKDNDTTTSIDVPIKEKIVHEKYNKTSLINDIGIIVFNYSVTFTDTIRPICLPLKSEVGTRTAVKSMPFIVVWGHNKNGEEKALLLQVAQVPLMFNARCARAYPKRTIDVSNMCAGVHRGGQDPCSGNPGAPLVVPIEIAKRRVYYQIGLMSYSRKCSESNDPAVYSRLAHFVPWIEGVVTGRELV